MKLNLIGDMIFLKLIFDSEIKNFNYKQKSIENLEFRRNIKQFKV